MAKLSSYTKDTSITGKDLLAGSNYITTINNVDQFETNNFTIADLTSYFTQQISVDPGNLPLKSNGGLVYETTLGVDYLAIDLSATNITGQLANNDLVNSNITINNTVVPLGGSIDIPVGDITAVEAGVYLNGGGTIGDVTLNHDNTSRADTEASSTITSTFTAITSITSNATGHITSEETTTYTLPTDIYVNSAAVTGTTTKTITLGRTGGQSNITADFTDNDNYADTLNITGDATKTVTIGRTGSLTDLTANFTDNDNYVDNITVTEPTSTTKRITIGRTGTLLDLTADFTDNDTIPNDGLLDINQGTDISLTITGGDFTADKDTETDIVINHANITRSPNTTSSVGPNHGGTFTAIDSITSSATGHITVANLKTVTLPNGANDNTITLSAGTYLSGGGDFTVDQSFDETITINHDSTTRSDTTSTASPAHGADFTTVDSVTTNATGHVTSINLKTITLPDDDNTDILQRISADSTNAERYVTFVNSATGDLEAGSDATFRFNPSTNKLTVTNLEVTGTQTINNVEVINTSGGIVFEGSVDDAYETTFNVINPTADRAINLPNKSGTVALLDDIPTVNDGTLTVQGSNGLTGSGTFTANDADSPTITISHADTSSQPSVNNTNNDFIQDITLDDYGHITAITSATATDTITQIREDNGSYRTGSITLQSGTNVTITEPSTNVFNFAATNTTYSAGVGLSLSGTTFNANVVNSLTTQVPQTITTTANRLYQVETDDQNNLVVNVPWTEGTNNYVNGANVTGTTTKTLTLTRQGLSDVTAQWTDIDNYVTGATVTGTTTKTLTLTRSGGLSNITAQWSDLNDDTTNWYVANSAGTNQFQVTDSEQVRFAASGASSVSFNATSQTVTYSSTDTQPNNGVLTINTAGIATGGGTFTANQAGNSTITITATEADTLATVTGRGNTTSATISVNQVIATNNGNGTNYRIGDDVWIGDINIANTFRVQGVQDATKGYITFGSSSNAALGRSGTGALTWDSNTIWHAGNDGAGSGLDADLLDGIQSSDFFKKQADLGGGQDLNNYTTDGYYHQNSNANANSGSNYPVGAAGMLSVVSDGVMVYQTYHQYNGNAYYHRSYYNGSWYSWRKVWQDGNDGSGSGLDADLLDGLHASAFLTSYTETDTLATVTSRNNSTSNNIFVGDIYRNGATGFYLKLNNTAQAMRAAGQIEINNNDSGIILLSTNSSASNATQLQLYHNFGDVFFQNLRGNIQLVANGYTYTNSSFGVGTTPGVKLDVYDSGTSTNLIRARNATQQIALGVNNTSGGAFLFVNSNHDLRFGTNGSEVGRFKTSGEFVVAQSTSDTNAAIRLGGDNAPGGRLYLEYNGDNSYIDCYGGHGSTQRYRDFNIVSRNLYLKGNNNLGITVESTGKVNVGSSASVPTNIQLQSSGDIRVNSTSCSLWLGGYNDSQTGRVRLHNANGAGYLDWEAASGTSSFTFRYDTSSRFEMSSGGTFTASADIVAYGSPSDITLKENIKPIENALDKVEKLQGVTFDWKESDSILDIKEDIGFIAQDVQKVLPELVRENENGKLSLRHQGIVPILLEAIKELSDKVKALENGITK